MLLRGTIVNRTYGTHKKLYIFLFLLTKFGPIYHGPRNHSGSLEEFKPSGNIEQKKTTPTL